MLKDFLEQHSPALNELLHGNLTEIAENTGLHRQTVGRILRGEEGYSIETMVKVLDEAGKILERKQTQYIQYGQRIKNLVRDSAVPGA